MKPIKTLRFGGQKGDFDYLYDNRYENIEKAKEHLKYEASVGQQFLVKKPEGGVDLYLWQGRDREPVLVGSGGEIYFSVTKPQLDLLITTSSLIPNALYEISGCDVDLYGGTTLYLRAFTSDELENNGIGKFYNPKYNQEVEGYGIYDVDTDYSVNDTTIWGGRKWVCKATTANEEPIDQFTLDGTKWDVLPYNNTEYNVVFDEIKYDYDNDWIAERHEVAGGNIVSCSKATYDIKGFEYNAIKSFQWGNVFNINMYKGLTSNIVSESWFDCVNSRLDYISNNTLNNSFIFDNTLNSGSISKNTLNSSSDISYNTLNSGSGIYNNTLNSGYINGSTLNSSSDISNNTLNSGSDISDNALNSGSSIYNNTLNSGNISYNTLNSGSSIYNNTLNSGYINGSTLNSSSIYNNTLNSGSIIFGTITADIISAVLSNTSSSSQITLGATAKTILSSNYSKEVKINANNETVIQYINESNQLIIVPITS